MDSPPPMESGRFAFVLRAERDDVAGVWLGHVDGLTTAAAAAASLPALLREIAGDVEQIATACNRIEWLDWYRDSMPSHMRGDYA